MLHITQTDRHRSMSVYSLSLSIHSLGSCCLHTLTPPPPHDSRRACVCVCAFGSLSSNASDVPITGHIMIIIMPRTNNRRTPRHSNTPRHALLGAGHGVLCVCIGVSCCEAAVRGGRVEIRAVPPPPPACCHKSSRQTCRRQARTFPPCCCCYKHNERLRNAHFIRCPPPVRCSSLARPPSPTPHTHTCIYTYILCIQYNRTPHWPPPPPPPPATTSHHPPRRRSRPTISAQYYRIIIIRRHVIEYVGTWMEHHQSQREEKGAAAAAAAEANVMYGRAIYTYIYI